MVLKNMQVKIMELLIILTLVLYCLNFLGKGNLIPILLSPFLLFFLLKKNITVRYWINISVLMFFSLFFSFSSYYYNFLESYISLIYMILIPILMFFLGYLVVENDYNFLKTQKYVSVVIISFIVFSVLCYVKTINSFGSITSASAALKGRIVLDFWSDNMISATGFNTYLSLGLCLLPMLFTKISSKLKLIYFMCFSISLFFVIELGNRTGILILVASVIVGIIFFNYSLKKMVIIFVLLTLIPLIKFIYERYIILIKTDLDYNNVFIRLMESESYQDPRFLSWKEAFWGIFKFPLGDRKTDLSLSYAHNLWLDIAYDVGLIPFLLIVIFSLFSIGALVRLCLSKIPMKIKMLFLMLYTSIFITFMLEPIMQGWSKYFMIFCFFVGIIHRLNYEYKIKNSVHIE